MTWIKQRTAEYRMTNDGTALRNLFKNRQNTFIGNSMLDVRRSSVSFSIKLAAFQASGGADTWINVTN
jgi:hypothetical protein